MNQILKRLEIIKSALSIDEEEIIELQVIKLKKLEIDTEVTEILNKLENLDYGSVVDDIDKYLSRYSGLAIYEDKEVQGLKLELKSLEKKLQKLSEQKSEYLNDIDEFNRLYHLKLGSLIQEILRLKQEILQEELKNKAKRYQEEKSLHVDTKETIDEIKQKIDEIEEFLEDTDEDDESYEEINQAYEELKESLRELEDELENQSEILDELEDDLKDEEFEKIKADYEEFSEEYEDIKKECVDICDISKEEKGLLKKLYRKASRLCHPDVVVDELKKQAHKIMQSLNAAYSKKDIKEVKKILKNLEKGIAFDVASDKIDDKKILKAKIEELRAKLDNVKKEIKDIKHDDTFEIISELDDWDKYFNDIKQALDDEMQTLKEELNDIGNNDKEKTLNIDKKPTKSTVKQEKSNYSKKLKSMELPTFEKIRRYCNNLVDENSADALQVDLAENGKMYKAFIYSALDEFLLNMNRKTINIVDWDCKQGMATALVLDYIREKQLDIKVADVVLAEKDEKYLSRAMVYVDVLKKETVHVTPINKALEDINLNKITADNNYITLFLGLNSDNASYRLKMTNKNFKLPIYYIFIDFEYDSNVDDIYRYMKHNFKAELISQKVGKVGKYQRSENIFKVTR
jgi:chromosome segregation ATPase